MTGEVFLDRGDLSLQILVAVAPPRSLELGLLRRGFVRSLCIQIASECRRLGFGFAGGALQLGQTFSLDPLPLTRGVE
jgi:hypothetical protein